MSGLTCKYCGYQARGARRSDAALDYVDHIKKTGHSRKNTANTEELEVMRQRTAEQEQATGQGERLAFPGLGVRVRDELVYAGTFTEGHLLGELKGALAEITDATKAQMIRAGLASGVALGSLIGPAALLPGVFRKSKAVAFVVFANGIVRERKLDGNLAIRSAQRDVVKFNALAAASQPAEEPQPPAAPKTIAERLAELTQLHEAGLLTDDEYQAKRAGIIDQI